MNSHMGVLHFGGDFDNDHPDPELRGRGPMLELVAVGPEEHCWQALARWTARHPLRRDEQAEVLRRDETLVRQEAAEARRITELLAEHDRGPDEGPLRPPEGPSA